MRRIRWLLLGVLVLLVLVVAGGVAYGVRAVRAPFPQTAGTLQVPGLRGEVHVLRDEWGVPHLYAENEHDLFFAQGYVHAQDRFWQMEFWRHISFGRLSEIVGEATVESDRFIRTMGWNRIAERTTAHYEANEPEIMALLDAYSAGVNAYIDANRDALSLNVTLLQAVNGPWEIEPWEPKHTIGWSVVMADDLSGNWGDEMDRAALIDALGEAQARALMPLYPPDRPVIVPTEELARTATPLALDPALDWRRVSTALVGDVPPDGFVFGAGDGVGSNNWVIGGAHTDSGLPLLADDPHLGIQVPSIWYEIGLHAPGWDVVGFTFAGAPGVVIGHNERIAWGVTNGAVDVQDLFVERLNPDDPTQYEFEGEWRDMEIIEETILVNGGDPVTLTVYETHHGPLITELLDDTEQPIALRWTAAAEPSGLVRSILDLNRAQTFDEFRAALRFWDVPAQNFVYADVDGNIGYQLPGLIPVRRNGDGLLPVPGWTGEYEWVSWVPYEELPTLFNPEKGYIVTANNAVVDSDYPHLLELMWSDGDRAQRITDLIEQGIARGPITKDYIGTMHMDSLSLLGVQYQPLLAELQSDDERVRAALARLRDWDGQLRRDSVGAALWEIFYMHLAEATLADELGAEAEDYLGNTGHQRVLFHQLAAQPDAPWWDDVTTPAPETMQVTMLDALADTVAWFETTLGGEMDDWTWGAIHTAAFVSAPLGQSGVSVIEGVVNRGPASVDGGTSAINANGWSFDDPARVRGHVSMRMIVDLADLDASRSVHATGQSGHPYHPHYFDLFPLWQNGRYHPMLWSREAVEAAAVDHLVLTP